MKRKTNTREGKVKKTRAKREFPPWLAAFSNKALPPLFFLLLALIALQLIPAAFKTSLRILLGVVTVVASSLSLYLAVILL